MSGKWSALLSLAADVRGISGKLKLLSSTAAGELRRKHYRQNPTLVEVPFKPFRLCFQIAQGELTPYLELRDVVRQIVPAGDELAKWTILDCGANIGMFSLFFRGARRIIAVEPNPQCAARIRRNFELNGVHGEVVEAAVSEMDGTVKMSFDPAASVLSKISIDGSTEVRSLTLDSILQQQAIDVVDLLKLDLEGHEMPAFRGARASLERRAFRRIFTECYGEEQQAQIDEFLRPYGLRRTSSHDFNLLYELISG